MASAVLVGAAIYRNISDATTRNLPLAGIVDAAGTVTAIQDGDFLVLFVFYSGGSTTNTVTGLTGLTKLDDNVGTGATSTVYYKQNCVASTDAAATLTIATSTSNRTNAIVMVYRNVPPTGTPILGWAKNSQASNVSSVGPLATPTAVGGIQLELVMWSTTAAPTTTPVPAPAAGLTVFRTEPNSGTMPGHTGAMSNFGSPGTSSGTAAHNLTPATTLAAVGGSTWTTETQAVSGNSTKWVIILAGTPAVTSVRPVTSISSTGMSNVGTAASILAALADDLDTTLGETADDPIAVVEEVKFAPLTAQARVGLNSRLSVTSSTTGSVTFLIQIRQGAATVICSKSIVVASTDGIVADVLTSTTAEASAITDWSDLRARWTMTKV
jgi:hypothetical protein